MNREEIVRLFSRMPTIETERLTLRPMRVSDAEDMYCYARRSDVTEYLLWTPHLSRSYTEKYLKYIEGRYRLGDFYDWAVVDKQSGRMIGTCGFTRFDCPNNVGEIGYVLSPEFHGRGFGTEAASRVLAFGFEELGLHRIEVKFMEGNTASRHVAEKLGMKFEGYRRDGMLVKGIYRTIGMSAILAEEYFARKKNPS